MRTFQSRRTIRGPLTTDSRRHRSGSIFVVFVVGLLVGLLAGSASAGNWTGRRAGDDPQGDVRFSQCNLMTNTHDAFHSNDSHDIEPTQVQTHLYHTCTAYEVYMNDLAYGTDDPTGWYECHQYDPYPNICLEGHAHINTSYSNIPEDYNRTLTLVCEEIGHSVGLDHISLSTSCMSAYLSALHLDQDHDWWHLNVNY